MSGGTGVKVIQKSNSISFRVFGSCLSRFELMAHCHWTEILFSSKWDRNVITGSFEFRFNVKIESSTGNQNPENEFIYFFFGRNVQRKLKGVHKLPTTWRYPFWLIIGCKFNKLYDFFVFSIT